MAKGLRMTASRTKLTKAAIDKLSPVPGRQFILWDTAVRGFGVRVSPGGAKAYVWQGRRGKDLIKITLGRCDSVPLESARQKAHQAIMTTAQGADPRAAKS